jgi:hypothetical protein
MTEQGTQRIYKAVPLPLGTYIRVIRIRPGAETDPIACDFRLLDLDDGALCDFNANSSQLNDDGQRYVDTSLPRQEKVPYTALSYTWGDSTTLHSIHIDDKPLQVRQNLWNFLHCARRNSLADYLWIDALCIDQSQLQERNNQVSMMGDIYSRAERVVVWLGTVSKEVKITMKALRKKGLRFDRESSSVYTQGVYELYELAYWSRAWIVQEFVLAKAIAIWCETTGHKTFRIDGDTLEPTRVSRSHEPSATRVIKARIERRRRSRLASEGEAQDVDYYFDTTLLGFLAFFCRTLHCADPKDQIYSLLSLLSSAERARLAVTPDYSKSTSELFASVVRSFHTPKNDREASHFRFAVDNLVRMLKLDEEDEVVRNARIIGASRDLTVHAGREKHRGEERSEESGRLSEGDKLSTIDRLGCNLM